MKKTNVLFHADDYGSNPEMSENILKCIKKGLVNSVSVLIDNDFKVHKKLKNIEGVNVRLHLNLTELKSKNINKTKFLKNLTFIKLLILSKKKKQIVYHEIDRQIKKFKKIYKPKIFRIDGHEHIHMIPWIFNYLLKNRNKYKIKQIRNSNEIIMSPRVNDFLKLSYYRNLLACLLLKFFYHYNPKNYYNSPQFAGMIYSGNQNFETIIKTLDNLKKKKIKNCEILIHPGFNKFKKNYSKFQNSKNRKIEYNLCFFEGLRNEIRKF